MHVISTLPLSVQVQSIHEFHSLHPLQTREKIIQSLDLLSDIHIQTLVRSVSLVKEAISHLISTPKEKSLTQLILQTKSMPQSRRQTPVSAKPGAQLCRPGPSLDPRPSRLRRRIEIRVSVQCGDHCLFRARNSNRVSRRHSGGGGGHSVYSVVGKACWV